eukprot:UN2114
MRKKEPRSAAPEHTVGIGYIHRGLHPHGGTRCGNLAPIFPTGKATCGGGAPGPPVRTEPSIGTTSRGLKHMIT